MVHRLSADDGIVAAAGMCATRLSVIAARTEANGPASRPPPGHGWSRCPLGPGALPPDFFGHGIVEGNGADEDVEDQAIEGGFAGGWPVDSVLGRSLCMPPAGRAEVPRARQ